MTPLFTYFPNGLFIKVKDVWKDVEAAAEIRRKEYQHNKRSKAALKGWEKRKLKTDNNGI